MDVQNLQGMIANLAKGAVFTGENNVRGKAPPKGENFTARLNSALTRSPKTDNTAISENIAVNGNIAANENIAVNDQELNQNPESVPNETAVLPENNGEVPVAAIVVENILAQLDPFQGNASLLEEDTHYLLDTQATETNETKTNETTIPVKADQEQVFQPVIIPRMMTMPRITVLPDVTVPNQETSTIMRPAEMAPPIKDAVRQGVTLPAEKPVDLMNFRRYQTSSKTRHPANSAGNIQQHRQSGS